MSAEIVGPFNDYRLVVDGWEVPFMQAIEVDGGRINLVVDHRLGFSVSAAEFDQVARLVAHSIAVALGMASHPEGDLSEEERQRRMGHLHQALRPRRLMEITSMESES